MQANSWLSNMNIQTTVSFPFSVAHLQCHHLKMISKVQNLRSFSFLLGISMSKDLKQKYAVVKVGMLQDWKMYCLHTCVCTFQPKKILQAGTVKGLRLLNCDGLGAFAFTPIFTSRGSEGVTITEL